MAIGSCPKHGDYIATESTLMGRKLKAMCPKCAHEELDIERSGAAAKHFANINKSVSGLPARYAAYQFNMLEVRSKADVAMRNRLMRFAADFKHRAERWPAFMIFSVGEQNAPMASALLNALAQDGYHVSYLGAQEFILTVRATYSRQSQETELEVINRYAQPDCLVVDGPENIRNSMDDRLLLSTLIEKRFKAGKPTILLTRGDLFSVAERLNETVSALMVDTKNTVMYDLQAR